MQLTRENRIKDHFEIKGLIGTTRRYFYLKSENPKEEIGKERERPTNMNAYRERLTRGRKKGGERSAAAGEGERKSISFRILESARILSRGVLYSRIFYL